MTYTTYRTYGGPGRTSFPLAPSTFRDDGETRQILLQNCIADARCELKDRRFWYHVCTRGQYFGGFVGCGLLFPGEGGGRK